MKQLLIVVLFFASVISVEAGEGGRNPMRWVSTDLFVIEQQALGVLELLKSYALNNEQVLDVGGKTFRKYKEALDRVLAKMPSRMSSDFTNYINDQFAQILTTIEAQIKASDDLSESY